MGSSEHAGNSSSGSVVGVDVNGEIGVLLAKSTHEHLGGFGLEEASHVLDCKNMDPKIVQLTGELEIIFQVVHAAIGIGNVSSVADGCLDNTSSLANCIDAKPHIFQIVERVEYTKDVHASVLGMLAELVHNIVRVAGVANRVGAAEEHLEGDVRHRFPHMCKAIPRALAKKSHAHIEGSPSPILDRVGVGQSDTTGIGDIEHVDSAHPGG